MFSMYLSTESNSANSEITFGGYNSKYTGENAFNWEPVADKDKNSWSVNMKKLQFGSATIEGNRNLYLRTGEPYIRMPAGTFRCNEQPTSMSSRITCNANLSAATMPTSISSATSATTTLLTSMTSAFLLRKLN